MTPSFQVRPWHRIAFTVFGLVVMLVIRRKWLLGGEISVWVEISAWLVLVAVMVWTRHLEARFAGMVERLFYRGAFSAPDETAASFLSTVERRASINARIGAIVFPLVVVLAYLYVHSHRWLLDEFVWIKLTLELIAATFVGAIAGRMVTYGCIGFWLKRRRVEVNVRLGHPDGAGGLRLVGDYFFFQAGIVLLAAIFFGFWWAVSPAWPDAAAKFPGFDYLKWRDPLVLFFAITLVVELLAFLAPMTFIHREMVRHGERFHREADDVGEAILDLRSRMKEPGGTDEIGSLLEQRELLENRFELLESAPTWPVDAGVRKRFAWGNLAVVVVPILAKLPASPEIISDTLNNLLQLQDK